MSLNWLDIVIIGIIAIGALRGYRIGIFGALVNVIALIIGVLIASQIAYALGLLGGQFGITGGALIAAIFAITIGIVVTALQLAWKAIRVPLGIVTLGTSSMIDRIGGALLGTALGVILAAAIVLALARLTYDAPLEIASIPISTTQVRAGLETSLTESTIVKTFARQTQNLPLNGLGFITPGFAKSLEIIGRT